MTIWTLWWNLKSITLWKIGYPPTNVPDLNFHGDCCFNNNKNLLYIHTPILRVWAYRIYFIWLCTNYAYIRKWFEEHLQNFHICKKPNEEFHLEKDCPPASRLIICKTKKAWNSIIIIIIIIPGTGSTRIPGGGNTNENVFWSVWRPIVHHICLA